MLMFFLRETIALEHLEEFLKNRKENFGKFNVYQ